LTTYAGTATKFAEEVALQPQARVARPASIDALAAEAKSITTIDEFKAWARKDLRAFFPHGALLSGFGHLHAGGVGFDYDLLVDCPTAYFVRISSPGGGIDRPILRRWLVTREPQVFESDRPWHDIHPVCLAVFREYAMKNCVVHGVYDDVQCVVTYHCFYRIPGAVGSAHVETAKQLTPLMHQTLCRVIGDIGGNKGFVARLAALSPRENEIARFASSGKTNGQIAKLLRLSENTIKHNLSRIFDKLAVSTRAELACRFAEASVPRSRTTIL
jgi:DNA-binding CsgD family transcriptional regulator